jgi:hypothetical protein
MIIWLASYPKSGNTLLRSMLSAYFFSQDGIYNFELIKNIKQFPAINLFEDLGINIKDDVEVVKNYISVQKTFNKKNSVQFCKTHSYLFNFYNKYPFTNLENSLGVIYIVRDPRNVVSSYANFLSCSDETSASIMIEELSRGGNLNLPRKDADRTKVWMGTWASNFNSWKPFKNQNRYLLVKYEELINKPEKTFLKILGFIHRLGKSKLLINQTKLENTIRTTSFDNLKNLEKKNGFPEAPHKNNKKNTPFFHKGPERNWKVTLEISIKNKIETAFKKEMMELGYL